jgi:16S rRNA (cytosine967-C5)-methyltransferase
MTATWQLRFLGRQPTARTVALEVLDECRRGEAFVQEILDAHLSRAGLGGPDRRLATQLAIGVIRRCGTLDALLRPHVTRPPHKVEAWLWDALRLGTFQLALLTHIPPHAALNETVELATQFGRPDAKGFLNGVLRKIAPLMTDERGSDPSADALPLEHGEYRRLARPVLPEPAAAPVEYLATAFSLPPWLASRWLERYGAEEALRLGMWFAGPAPLWLRVNPLQTTREAFLEALQRAGIEAEAGEHPQAVRLKEHASIRELPGFADGWFSVQDQSAMNVASALAPEPGWRVLDVCAAPGGKSTHLAELMGGTGSVVASDVDGERLRLLEDSCRRLGLANVETVRSQEEPPAGPFDAVLVDVPCSNTGVLGRRPEARWRLRPTDLRHLVPLQTKLLIQAGEWVRPGGVVVYSTCSIEPAENRPVVDAVRQGLRDLEFEAEQEQSPGRPADGGYWARLRRKG